MLKAFLQRRRIRKNLGRYVSPDIARQIADGSFTVPIPSHIERSIEVALVLITASDAPGYSERAGVVADLAMQHEGVVHSLLPVLVVGFGCVSAGPPDSCRRFVASVQSGFSDAAIVHGTVTASVGTFGSNNRLVFGFWWPGALDALRQLAALTPGHIHELHPNDRNA